MAILALFITQNLKDISVILQDRAYYSLVSVTENFQCIHIAISVLYIRSVVFSKVRAAEANELTRNKLSLCSIHSGLSFYLNSSTNLYFFVYDLEKKIIIN